MAILLLAICFVSIFFAIESYTRLLYSKKETLLITVFIFGVLIVAITEGLSALNWLNYWGLVLSWGSIVLLNTIYLYTNKTKLLNINFFVKQQLLRLRLHFTLFEKLFLAFAATLLLLLFVQGLAYPPNNWDSMTYHMARITSWVSHQNVSHYPTPILRQIYQPPFSEYVIMHFNLLSKSDYFANAVQWFFLVFSIISIVLIMESLKVGKKYKIAAIILAITIPEVILQASSTQNDLVTSFFTLSAFYFFTKALRNCTVFNYLIAGLIIGIALLTKGTSYLYFAPLLLIWGLAALRQLYITKNYNYIWFFAISAMVAVSINASFYYRNYELTHSVLGISKKESVQYANQKITPALLLSSMVKNAGLHMGLKHVHPIASYANKAIYKLHDVAGININDPDVNFYGSTFSTNDLPSDEDFAPNLLHFVLIIIAAAALLAQVTKHNVNNISKLLLAVIMLQVILFCGYLKWQAYATRLHTPIFLLSIPVVCYMLFVSKGLRNVGKVIIPLILIYSVMIVMANRQRPYDRHLFTDRYAKFFTTRDDIQPDYTLVDKIINTKLYKNVGLIVNRDAWTYPLFYNCFSKSINPIYLNVDNFTKNCPQFTSGQLDCIVTTDVNQPYIDHHGIRFYNKTGVNKKLFIYAR